jgi:hypothetical protein
VIRIAITTEAFDAVSARLPLGTVSFERDQIRNAQASVRLVFSKGNCRGLKKGPRRDCDMASIPSKRAWSVLSLAFGRTDDAEQARAQVAKAVAKAVRVISPD